MPRLIIDDLEVEVPRGSKVIDAAERLGIIIPRFCYHEALGAVGACRMCAVKFVQGPFKGVQMSCMIDAQDGMVVSTTDEEAVQFRKRVIELLMIAPVRSRATRIGRTPRTFFEAEDLLNLQQRAQKELEVNPTLLELKQRLEKAYAADAGERVEIEL